VRVAGFWALTGDGLVLSAADWLDGGGERDLAFFEDLLLE
jgi:hypothetical protein